MEPPDEFEAYVNATQAAEMLRISPKTMLRWIKAGRVRIIDKRYDHYENAEFLIPLSEVERLKAALQMSQRELVTRVLKLELDVQTLSHDQLAARLSINTLQGEVARLRHLLITVMKLSGFPISEEELAESEAYPAPAPAPLSPYTRPGLEEEAEPLPLGSAKLTVFLREHGVATTTGLDHLVKAGISPILLDRRARDHSRERWLSPQAQWRLVLYWQREGKPFTSCNECPHEPLSNDSAAPAGEE